MEKKEDGMKKGICGLVLAGLPGVGAGPPLKRKRCNASNPTVYTADVRKCALTL